MVGVVWEVREVFSGLGADSQPCWSTGAVVQSKGPEMKLCLHLPSLSSSFCGPVMSLTATVELSSLLKFVSELLILIRLFLIM